MPRDQVRMSVLASPAAVGVVRDRFQRTLTRWGVPPGHRDDVLLCASELLTNSVTAAPRRELRAGLSREGRAVLLEVWDPGDALPRLRPMADPALDDLDLTPEGFDDNGGRGLHIVAALATEYGCTPHPPTGGKTVWARFTVRLM
jgi:anti-sigma regulatory factor (Ser/Thr protein kinase)